MRRKMYTQRIKGKLRSITLMPTYGTASYLFAEKVGLPKTIDRYEKETLLAYRKRVNSVLLGIEAKIRKIHGMSDTGVWKKDKFDNTHVVRHDYALSELKQKG